jgi:hypothetical protein
MSTSDALRFGAPGDRTVHLCVDMQRMFAEDTEWKMPWLERVLPNVISITSFTSRTDHLYALHPRTISQAGRGDVAALLCALGIDDHR